MPAMSSQEGTFDNVKPTFSGEQGTTIKQLINSHMIRRQIVSCLMSPGEFTWVFNEKSNS